MTCDVFLNVWQQADGVIRACAIVLLMMSILSWTVIVWRAGRYLTYRRRHLRQGHALPPCIREALEMSGVSDEHRTLALQTAVDEESLTLGSGLVIPALVGATAPFVGLLGTVWGIYGTMLRLGSEARMLTIADVAGPVGETLIMTALGLAVAIPAVIGYNLLEKARQRLSAELAICVNRALMTRKADGEERAR